MEAGVLYDPTVSSCELSKKKHQKFRQAFDIPNNFSENFLQQLSKNNTPEDLPFNNDATIGNCRFERMKLGEREKGQLFAVLLNGVSDGVISAAKKDTESQEHFDASSVTLATPLQIASAIAETWKGSLISWDKMLFAYTDSFLGLRTILEKEKIVAVSSRERKKKGYHLSVIRPLYFTVIRANGIEKLKSVISKFIATVVNFSPLFSFTINSCLYVAYRTQEQAQIMANIIEISFFSEEMGTFSLGKLNVRFFAPGTTSVIVGATMLQQKPALPDEILSCKCLVLTGVKDFNTDFFKRSFKNPKIEKVQQIPESISPAMLITCVDANDAPFVYTLLHTQGAGGVKCTVLPLVANDPLIRGFFKTTVPSNSVQQTTLKLLAEPPQEHHPAQKGLKDTKVVDADIRKLPSSNTAESALQNRLQSSNDRFTVSTREYAGKEIGTVSQDHLNASTSVSKKESISQNVSIGTVAKKSNAERESTSKKGVLSNQLISKKIKDESAHVESISSSTKENKSKTSTPIVAKKEAKISSKVKQASSQQQLPLIKNNVNSNEFIHEVKYISSDINNDSKENRDNSSKKVAKLVYLKKGITDKNNESAKKSLATSANLQNVVGSPASQSCMVSAKGTENIEPTRSILRQAKVQTILSLEKESSTKPFVSDIIKSQSENVSDAVERISHALDNVNVVSVTNTMSERSLSDEPIRGSVFSAELRQTPINSVQLPWEFAAAVTGGPMSTKQKDENVKKMLIESEAILKVKAEKRHYFTKLDNQAIELEKDFKAVLADNTKAQILRYKIDWLKANLDACKDATVQLNTLQTEYNNLTEKYFALAFNNAKAEAYNEALADLARCVCVEGSVKKEHTFSFDDSKLIQQLGKILYEKLSDFLKSVTHVDEKESRTATSSNDKVKKFSSDDVEKLKKTLTSCVAKQIEELFSNALLKKVPTSVGSPLTILSNLERSFRQKVYGFVQAKLSIFELKKQYDVSLSMRTKLDELERFNEQLNKIDEIVYTHAPIGILSDTMPSVDTVCLKETAQIPRENAVSGVVHGCLESSTNLQCLVNSPDEAKRKSASLQKAAQGSLQLTAPCSKLDCDALEYYVEKLYKEWGESSRGRFDALFSRLLLLAGREGYLYDQELSFLRSQHHKLLQKLQREFEVQETVRALQQENRECMRLIKLNLSRDTDNYANALHDKLIDIFYYLNAGPQQKSLPDSLHQIVDVVLSDKVLARALLASVLTSNFRQFNIATNKLQQESPRRQKYPPTNEQLTKRRRIIYAICKKRLELDQRRTRYASLRLQLELSRRGLTNKDIMKQMASILKKKRFTYHKAKHVNLLSKFSIITQRCSKLDKEIIKQNSAFQFDGLPTEASIKNHDSSSCVEQKGNRSQEFVQSTTEPLSAFRGEKLNNTKIIDDLIATGSVHLSEIENLRKKVHQLEKELRCRNRSAESSKRNKYYNSKDDENKQNEDKKLLSKIDALENANSRIKEENTHLTERLNQRKEMHAAVREAYENCMANGENQGFVDCLENHRIKYALLKGRFKLFKRKHKALSFELDDAKSQLRDLTEKYSALIQNTSKDSSNCSKKSHSEKESIDGKSDNQCISSEEKIVALEEENEMLKNKLITLENDKEVLFSQLGKCFVDEKSHPLGTGVAKPEHADSYKFLVNKLLTERLELKKSLAAKDTLIESIQKQYQDSLVTAANLKITVDELNKKLNDGLYIKSLAEPELPESKQFLHTEPAQKSSSHSSVASGKAIVESKPQKVVPPSQLQQRMGSVFENAQFSKVLDEFVVNTQNSDSNDQKTSNSKTMEQSTSNDLGETGNTLQESLHARKLLVSDKQTLSDTIKQSDVQNEHLPNAGQVSLTCVTSDSVPRTEKSDLTSREIIHIPTPLFDARALASSISNIATHLSSRLFYYSFKGASLEYDVSAILDDLLKQQETNIQKIISLSGHQDESRFVLKDASRVSYDEALVVSEKIARLFNSLLQNEDESVKRERLGFFDSPLRFSRQLDFYERLVQFDHEEAFCNEMKKASLGDAVQTYFSQLMEFNELSSLNRRLWLLKTRIKTRKDEIASEIKILKILFPGVGAFSARLEAKLDEFCRHNELFSSVVADQKKHLLPILDSMQEQHPKISTAEETNEQAEQKPHSSFGQERIDKFAEFAMSEIAKSKKKFLETPDISSSIGISTTSVPPMKRSRHDADSDESRTLNKRIFLSENKQQK